MMKVRLAKKRKKGNDFHEPISYRGLRANITSNHPVDPDT